jgi:hypothetical protein
MLKQRQNHSPQKLDRKTRQSRSPRPIKKCTQNVHLPNLQQNQRTHRRKPRPQNRNQQPQTQPNTLRKPPHPILKTHVPNTHRRPHQKHQTLPRKTQRPQRHHPTKTQTNRHHQNTRTQMHLHPLRCTTPRTSSRETQFRRGNLKPAPKTGHRLFRVRVQMHLMQMLYLSETSGLPAKRSIREERLDSDHTAKVRAKIAF